MRGRGLLGAPAAGAIVGTALGGVRRPHYGFGRPVMRPMFRPFIY